MTDTINQHLTNDILKRIAELEKYRDYFNEGLKKDLENNRSLYLAVIERLDTIENYLHKHDERIKQTENYITRDDEATLAHGLLIRVKQIEDFIGQNYKVDVKEIHRILEEHRKISISPRLAPFKCPCCNGIGNRISNEQSNYQGGKCNPCEGKGIIWG